MHVSVDSNKCQGHGRCYAMAPEVFAEDDEGRGEVIKDAISGDLIEGAQLGVANCPESAITLV